MKAIPLPRVISHLAVSADGRIAGFEADLGLFYGLAATWREDATLVGSETAVAGAAAAGVPRDGRTPADLPAADPRDRRPWLVICDSRGRVREWDWWRQQPYWRGGLALVSRATAGAYTRRLERHGIGYIVAGEKKVDLRAALAALRERYRVRTVRVDSGGALQGALLQAGLVDEVSLVVHPAVVGGANPSSAFSGAEFPAGTAAALRLTHVEKLNSGVVWLRYRVAKARS